MRPAPLPHSFATARGTHVLIAMLLASLAAISASGGLEAREGRGTTARGNVLGVMVDWTDAADASLVAITEEWSPASELGGRRVASASGGGPRGGFGGASAAEQLESRANTPPPTA